MASPAVIQSRVFLRRRLLALAVREGMTAQEIAIGLGVALATVYRDLDAMERMQLDRIASRDESRRIQREMEAESCDQSFD